MAYSGPLFARRPVLVVLCAWKNGSKFTTLLSGPWCSLHHWGLPFCSDIIAHPVPSFPSVKSQPIKTGKFGPKLDSLANQNNPFRAAYHGGHELNESYKLPAPNASGQNHSYMHPAVNKGAGSNTQKLQGKQKMPAGPMRTGKATAGF